MSGSVRTVTLEWPEADLGCPLAGAFSSTVGSSFDRSSITNHPPAYRLTRYDERRTMRLGFIWTVAQLAIFEAFFETDLNVGMRAFMMWLPADGQRRNLMCRISGPVSLIPVANRLDRQRVEFTIDAYWRVVASPSWAV